MVEQALREHLAHRGSVTDEVWERNQGAALGEEEALTLAHEELKAMRREQGDSGDGRTLQVGQEPGTDGDLEALPDLGEPELRRAVLRGDESGYQHAGVENDSLHYEAAYPS